MVSQYLVLPEHQDIRGARSYVGWSQTEFANKIGLALNSVTKIERGLQKPSKENLEVMARVFLEQGIKFQPNGGFHIEKESVKIFEGRDGYLKVVKDAMEVCAINKDEFLLLGADARRSSDKVNSRYKQITYHEKKPRFTEI